MAMSESPEIELVRRAWDAILTQGGPEVLGEVLALDARWYGVQDRQLCEGRKAIIDVVSGSGVGAPFPHDSQVMRVRITPSWRRRLIESEWP